MQEDAYSSCKVHDLIVIIASQSHKTSEETVMNDTSHAKVFLHHCCHQRHQLVSTGECSLTCFVMQGLGTEENPIDLEPEEEEEEETTAPLTSQERAEQHKQQGTEHYKSGNWQAACQEYG